MLYLKCTLKSKILHSLHDRKKKFNDYSLLHIKNFEVISNKKLDNCSW